MCFFWLFRRWHGVSSSTRAFPTRLRGQGTFWVHLNCSCSTRLVQTAAECLSFCHCALVLGIVRLVLRVATGPIFCSLVWLPNCCCSTLSADVTSQIWRSYLELCESLDVSESFLERSASNLFLQQVWLLRSTSTQNLCLRHCPCCCTGNGTLFEVFSFSSKFPLFWSSKVSWFEASCHSCLWNLLLDRA